LKTGKPANHTTPLPNVGTVPSGPQKSCVMAGRPLLIWPKNTIRAGKYDVSNATGYRLLPV